MTLAQTIIAMVEAGCSPEQMAAVARKFQELEPEDNRSSAAIRQARYRNNKHNAGVTNHNESVTQHNAVTVSDAKVSPPSPPLSSPPFLSPTPPNLTPPIIPPTTTPSKRSQASSDGLSVRAILGACLSETSIDDLIEHRRRKKSPMTARAAKELVKQFTEFGDPERAVATMIVRGWTGFEPGWMDNPARAGPKIVRQSCFETSRPYMGR
jgi:hypothetical protein